MAKKKEEVTEVESTEVSEVTEEAVETPITEEVESTEEAPEAEKPKKVKKEKDEDKKEVAAPTGKKIKHGKKYRAVEGKIEKGKEYTVEDAITLLKETATTKFDSSVEIHINLNIDTTKPDQQLRGSVSLPAGLGREKKIAVVAGPDKEKEAKDAGADIVGGQDLVERIEKGFLDFDVLIATPDMMAFVGRIGKILGTKGLMPNPKIGTVTPDPAKAVGEFKKGKVEYRPDKAGIVHAPIGKVSFANEALKENIETFVSEIHHNKPTGVKGTFVKGVHLTTTMGPGIKVQR